MNPVLRIAALPGLLLAAAVVAESPLAVKITADLESVQVMHNGVPIRIMRSQDPDNRVNPRYTLTSRSCPPFCIQPASIAPGVETIAELEVLDYLRRKSGGDASIMVIDSRTPDWLEHGTIPGSVNIPWTTLNPEAGADPFTITDTLVRQFGVQRREELLDYSGARTLVLFCNGPWCGQSPANIRTLLQFGYPPGKLKWYRGGMQDWEILGLTVALPESAP